MNKLLSFAAAGVLVVLPYSVFASTGVSITAQDATVAVGDTVAVTVELTPSGDTVYTTQLELLFPAEVLEVTDVELGEGWLELRKDGFDEVDNTAGVLMKTAGYPNGFTDETLFATVSFKARTAGDAVITVGDATTILDGKNANVYGAAKKFTITVGTSTSTKTPAGTTSGQGASSAPAQAGVSGEGMGTESQWGAPDATTYASTGSTSATSTDSSSDQVAAAGEAAEGSSRTLMYSILGVLLVVLGGVLYRKRKNA
jgi:LPXTG-motif cell wall-anchored protein